MVIYRSFFEALKDLPESNRLQVWDAICELGLNGVEVELSGLSKTIFTLIKPQIDANNRRAAAGKENGHKGGEYGKLGGRPPKQKPLNNPQDNPLETPNKPSNVNANENVNVNVNENYNVNDLPDSTESNPETIQTDSIQLYTPEPEKKKVAPKKKDHRFAESIYANDIDLFIEHWNNSETARTYPETDPIKVYTTLKNSSDASSKYKYSNWIAAAQNWVKRNPSEYKRTYTTPSGQQLHHNDQAIIDRVERLTRDYIGIQPPEY